MITIRRMKQSVQGSLIAHCERRAAKWSELAVEGFFSQSYGKSKKRDILKIHDFFGIDYE